jgi:hypothetical protein
MSDAKLVLVKDERIGQITDKESYSVFSGASEFTVQQISQNSASPSSLVFQAQIPSESIVVDRNVMLRGTVYFTITAQAPANSGLTTPIINIGSTEGFNAFPINQLFLTSTATINNVTVSSQTQDILQQILRMNSARELYRYNSTTPCVPSNAYGMYKDGVQSSNNPLGAYNDNSLDEDFSHNGSWSFNFESIVHTWNAGANTNASLNQNGSSSSVETWVIQCSATFAEPLLTLSPFTWCNPEYNSQGLLGLQNLAFTFQLDSQCRQFFKTAQTGYDGTTGRPVPTYITSVTLGTTAQPQAWSNTVLMFNYLSLQPSDIIPTRNVVPVMNFPRYITNQIASVAAWDATSLSTIPVQSAQSSSIQLQQIPDKFIICVRQAVGSQNYANTPSFCPIRSVQIVFNNKSGILSNALPEDLWRISRDNGSQQNYQEFLGYATVVNAATGKGSYVPTTGSLLVLDPARDFGLPNMLTNGSIGAFNFQINVTFANTQPYAQNNLELVILAVNSGLMVNDMGVSNIYQGILTPEMVLTTQEDKEVPELDRPEYERLVGGAHGRRLLRAKTGIAKLHRRVKSTHRKKGAAVQEMSAGSHGGGAHLIAHHRAKHHKGAKLAHLLRGGSSGHG